MNPLTPDLKMYPYLVMFDNGLHFIIPNCPIYAIDEASALEMAAADAWRGKPVWAYRGTNVEEAIYDFHKTLE